MVSSSYLLLARLLHYATLSLSEDIGRVALLSIPILAVALVHERLVRGALYSALRARLHPGLAAPAVAFVGGLVLAALRLAFLPRARAPFAVLAVHALLVETLLGFGLAWLALGSGSTVPGGIALGLVWIVRLGAAHVFHGGVVPLLELIFALLAALAVAGILSRELAPHRAAVLEAS